MNSCYSKFNFCNRFSNTWFNAFLAVTSLNFGTYGLFGKSPLQTSEVEAEKVDIIELVGFKSDNSEICEVSAHANQLINIPFGLRSRPDPILVVKGWSPD